MKAFLRRHKIAVAAITICIVVLATAWTLRAPIRGRMAAHYDVARGKYKVFSVGFIPQRRIFSRLLLKRYGIEVIAVPEESESKAVLAYTRGYNTVSVEAAKSRFGHDVFKECGDNAQKEWDKLSFTEQLFPDAGKKASNAACFRCFPQGTLIDKVVAACGRPDDVCNGRPCYRWDLEDGSTVVIYYDHDRMDAVAVYRGIKPADLGDWVSEVSTVPHK
jgi:hypothetical protein